MRATNLEKVFLWTFLFKLSYTARNPLDLESISMACKLSPHAGSIAFDPGNPAANGPTDFDSAKDAQITVFVDSDSGTVHLGAASLNGVSFALDANGNAAFKASNPVNALGMGFLGGVPGEVFRIKEDCGAGASQVLRTWAFDVANPTTEIRIHAS
jgi:hypothetical protein